VVDDNKINQKITQKILETRNFKCSLADGGTDAVAFAKNNHYQLILMDIHMPDKDGIQATKEIRSFDTTTPIVALTAVEADEIREVIYKAGMNDIILKPYDVSQFLNTILRNLNNTHANAI
jgi:CheY-like chemotaxis protein